MANLRVPFMAWCNRHLKLTANRTRRIATPPIVSAVAGAVMTAVPLPAGAHDWYPKDCCGGNDCAPAESVLRRKDGSYEVFARGMSVLIPSEYNEWKRSPDGRVHVCVREHLLACAFRGPGA